MSYTQKLNGQKPCREKINNNRKNVLELYNAGFCDSQISKRTNISIKSISKFLRSLNLPNNEHKLRNTNIMELYNKGFSDPEIAESLCFSVSAVFHWRKRNGLKSNLSGRRKDKK